jgi:predicted NAD/FAD-binding protein
MKDALFSGVGSADLLLPRVHLSALLPKPALVWLKQHHAAVHLSTRVMRIEPRKSAWTVDDQEFDSVIIATPPNEAARLAAPISRDWASITSAFQFEPIITVYLQSPGTVLPAPMHALRSNATRPAQFVFDRGQLGGPGGLLAFVISGARHWVDLGNEATLEATVAQAREAFGSMLRGPLVPVQILTEKRATFRCVPALHRPWAKVAPGLRTTSMAPILQRWKARFEAASTRPTALARGAPCTWGASKNQRRANGEAKGSPTKTPC